MGNRRPPRQPAAPPAKQRNTTAIVAYFAVFASLLAAAVSAWSAVTTSRADNDVQSAIARADNDVQSAIARAEQVADERAQVRSACADLSLAAKAVFADYGKWLVQQKGARVAYHPPVSVITGYSDELSRANVVLPADTYRTASELHNALVSFHDGVPIPTSEVRNFEGAQGLSVTVEGSSALDRYTAAEEKFVTFGRACNSVTDTDLLDEKAAGE